VSASRAHLASIGKNLLGVSALSTFVLFSAGAIAQVSRECKVL